ncbi:ABC transporter ATP-binding protein [bacterium]|jgi:ABC-2 type transport system ATP-binding protein|nr:ABC transporter ATP-binding protein [bacterium]
MSDLAIQTDGLTKVFGNFTAVDNISINVKKGEIFGFLGANGAGKTTAMKMLTGLLSPSSGDAKVSGYDVYSESELIKKNIGYMSQKFSLYDDLTPEENIRFYGGIYGLDSKQLSHKRKELIESLELGEVKKKLVGSFPLGWKQKLAFAISIIHEPNIVFLDEPTGGVDPITRRQFWERIYQVAESGVTVFVTTHYMDEAEYCDTVSIMVDGKIEAMDSPDNLKKTFETNSIEDIFIRLARAAKRGDR